MIIKNERKSYSTDLTDSQWELIRECFPPPGNKSKWEKRELTNAVLYLIDSGCKWGQLPHDFPPTTTVSNFYYACVKRGIWDKVLKLLVSKTRVAKGKSANPTYALIDSQSVKTLYASDERGFDGGKKRKDENGT
jgi:putative transposase